MGLALKISSAVRVREAIAKGLIVAALVIYIEVVVLIGIPFALAQVLIGGTSRRALARNCRETWRVYAVILVALLFCILAAMAFAEYGGAFYFVALPILASFWVLRAAAAMRTVGEEMARVPDPAFLKAWLFDVDRQRIRRGRSATRMRRAGLWFVLAGILVAGIVAVIAAQSAIGFRESVVTLCIVLGGFIGQRMLRRGRRHGQAGADERRRADERAPVLVLRSFTDDQIQFERGLSRLLNARQPSFEQLVTRECEALGPVIAIGQPGEALPPLGAARDYPRDADWQTVVRRLMEEAEILVFILGETEGLAWELRTAVETLDRKDSVLVVIPPLEPSMLESRWRHFVSNNIDVLGEHFPERPPEEPVLAIGLLRDSPLMVLGAARRKWDYRLAIRLWTRLKPNRLCTVSEVTNYLATNAPSVEIRLPSGSGPAEG